MKPTVCFPNLKKKRYIIGHLGLLFLSQHNPNNLTSLDVTYPEIESEIRK